MGFLAGKKALIVGLATERSIAWGIARAMQREGAELAFTYQNERIRERVEGLAGKIGSGIVMPLDVGIDEQIDAAFGGLKDAWGGGWRQTPGWPPEPAPGVLVGGRPRGRPGDRPTPWPRGWRSRP